MILRSPFARIAAALAAIFIASSLEISGSSTPAALQRETKSSRGSARVVIETSAQITARPIFIRPVILAYERLSIARHRVSLVLTRADSLEWGFTVTHVPAPGVTVIGAAAHIPIKPELRAIIEVSEALATGAAPPVSPSRTLWGVGLEWKRVVDPLAISAGIDYASSVLGDAADASIHGSISLLLTDTISLSLSASVSGMCQSNPSPALGISLAGRQAPYGTLYARIDSSLAPADSVCLSVGVVRELD
ncbi:MAG: hypothetical protein GXX08_02620 [Firmicutes bacterium]|nr:hypothetical protein [Bacillota bacterium]